MLKMRYTFDLLSVLLWGHQEWKQGMVTGVQLDEDLDYLSKQVGSVFRKEPVDIYIVEGQGLVSEMYQSQSALIARSAGEVQ